MMSRQELVRWFDRPIVGTLLTLFVVIGGGIFAYGQLTGRVDDMRATVHELTQHVFSTEGKVDALMTERHRATADAFDRTNLADMRPTH